MRQLIGVSVLWLGLGMLLDGMTALVLPERVLDVTSEASSATVLGLLTFCGIGAAILVQPLAGAFSDYTRPRWGRKGTVAAGVALALAALAAFGATSGLIALLLTFTLLQAAAAVAQAGQQGFIPDLVPQEKRGVASGLKGLMDILGAMLGFGLLSFLLATGSLTPALTAMAIVLVLALAATVLLVREPPAAALVPARSGRWQSSYKVDFRRNPGFGLAVASRFTFLLGAFAVQRFWLYFIADKLGIPRDQAETEAGLLLAALAAVTVLMALPAGWATDRFGRIAVMRMAALIAAFSAVLLPLASNPTMLFVFGSLMAVGTSAFVTANWAFTADAVPAGEAARYFGLANVGTAGAAAVAGLLGPVVDLADAQVSGLGFPLLFTVAAVAFATSALFVTAPAAKREPGPSPTGHRPTEGAWQRG